ncbi:MAG: hypothetical protein ABFD16_02085, partial [Thermoguttaceae bacterium]
QLHRFALTALILAATVISSAYGGQPAGSRSTPNIVFILADDKQQHLLERVRQMSRQPEKTEETRDSADQEQIAEDCRKFMRIDGD